MTMKLPQLTAKIWPEDELFVAICCELGTVSQGSSEQEAFDNLLAATGLFLEDADPIEIDERLRENGVHLDQEVRLFEMQA